MCRIIFKYLSIFKHLSKLNVWLVLFLYCSPLAATDSTQLQPPMVTPAPTPQAVHYVGQIGGFDKAWGGLTPANPYEKVGPPLLGATVPPVSPIAIRFLNTLSPDTTPGIFEYTSLTIPEDGRYKITWRFQFYHQGGGQTEAACIYFTKLSTGVTFEFLKVCTPPINPDNYAIIDTTTTQWTPNIVFEPRETIFRFNKNDTIKLTMAYLTKHPGTTDHVWLLQGSYITIDLVGPLN